MASATSSTWRVSPADSCASSVGSCAPMLDSRRYRRYASSVTVKAAGTAKPAAASRARFAPFPPTTRGSVAPAPSSARTSTMKAPKGVCARPAWSDAPGLAGLDYDCAAVAAARAQSPTVTVPEVPSTVTTVPLTSCWLAPVQDTTQGMPSSRLTIAAWLITAPTSVTTAAAETNSGVHEGSVALATRISARQHPVRLDRVADDPLDRLPHPLRQGEVLVRRARLVGRHPRLRPK